jgi:hypothetical protein
LDLLNFIGAPETTRTSDQRFRKTTADGVGSGTPYPEVDKRPLDSGSCIGQPEANGLRHHADPGGATKATNEVAADSGALRAVLADLVASLNERLGRGRYELNIEVLEGEVDIAGVDIGEVATDLGTTVRRDTTSSGSWSHDDGVGRRRGAGR